MEIERHFIPAGNAFINSIGTNLRVFYRFKPFHEKTGVSAIQNWHRDEI